MNRIEKLLKKADDISTYCFTKMIDGEEARKYAEELSKELHKEEERLSEEKKKLDDTIWELRHKESKVFEYYLSIK